MSHRMIFRRHPAIATPGVRRRRGSALAQRGGTTVFELLATVAVLGTFVSTTVLTTSQVRPLYIIRGAARQVAADLQKTRMSAVTENNRYVVQITSNHTDTILDDNNNDGVTEVGESVRTVDIQLDWPGVTMSSGGPITFLPNGTVAAPVVVTLQKAGTMDKTISISQAGSIRIQ
jgi:Tfp pilus assembly protein FimT